MYLRKSTASQEIKLGPFLDSTDGNTAETGLTINASDILITKGGATTEVAKNSGGATHVANGRYSAVLDATDTDTVGILEIDVHVSGALSVRRSYYVLEQAIFDLWFADGATGGVSVTSIGGSSLAATRLALSAAQIIPFTVDTVVNTHTPTTTEFQADDVTEATADHFNGRIIIFTSGNLAGQATDITDYAVVGGIGQFTVTALTEAPGNNDTGIIV